MQSYLDLMRRVLRCGEDRDDRTGVGTRALFGTSLEFDLRDGFPAVTTKRLAFGQVKAELACFLRGYEWLSDFHRAGCKIWDANATAEPWFTGWGLAEDGDVWLGRTYGVQWRRWRCSGLSRGVDQLANAVRLLRDQPTSRRIVVTAWNPCDLDATCLPPCHTMFQFGAFGPHLDCAVTMRSVDVFLGMPFDIASYALLAHVVARQTGRVARRLHMAFADTHVYRNHFDQCALQLTRTPKPLPALVLQDGTTIDNFDPDAARLVGYEHLGAIEGRMNP